MKRGGYERNLYNPWEVEEKGVKNGEDILFSYERKGVTQRERCAEEEEQRNKKGREVRTGRKLRKDGELMIESKERRKRREKGEVRMSSWDREGRRGGKKGEGKYEEQKRPRKIKKKEGKKCHERHV